LIRTDGDVMGENRQNGPEQASWPGASAAAGQLFRDL